MRRDSLSTSIRFCDAEISEIANEQRALNGMLLVALILIWFPPAWIAGPFFFAYRIYRLASALQLKDPWLYGVFCYVPIISVFLAWYVSSKATKVIQKHGLRVGFLGVSKHDLKMLAAKVASANPSANTPSLAIPPGGVNPPS